MLFRYVCFIDNDICTYSYTEEDNNLAQPNGLTKLL